jgi:serine O-acetyltransferase
MRFSEYRFLVKSDLYRYAGKVGVLSFLRCMWINPCFKYSFWLRTCTFFKQSEMWCHGVLTVIARNIFFLRYTYKYGISIPYVTKIGSGFVIGHFGGIVVSDRAVIGNNCTISHGVTVGKANRGKNKGHPTIGDNVYIGPGAKIIGNVRVGNNVAIGANCVVTKDVPDNAVVAGVPGKVISYDGTEGYLKRTDYPWLSGKIGEK